MFRRQTLTSSRAALAAATATTAVALSGYLYLRPQTVQLEGAAPLTTKKSDRLLPVPNRTESFWLTERDEKLYNMRTTAELPETADVVVVGSGLSGAMMAHKLIKKSAAKGKKLNVVMLEADECTGSATARNGGHCKPITFIGYRAWAKQHGKETANKLHEFEEEALGHYVKLVLEEDIDCDLHVTRAIDTFFLQDDAESGRLDYEARKRDFPESVKKHDVRFYTDLDEFEKLSGVKGGFAGASYPAGHLFPYKLATGLIKRSIDRGMNLQTYTPAIGLEKSGKDWKVQTERGSITAPLVVIATNAYTSSVLPEFKNLIIPVRGTACSVTPPEGHQLGGLPGPFRYSYGFRYGQGEVDYMIPRQGRGRVPGVGDRSLILGGAKGAYLKDLDNWYNNRNDDVVMDGVEDYFRGYLQKVFKEWKGDESNVDRVWTGVLGYSSDLRPLIGHHPERDGVYICAGFTGHGMPRIPGCTEALSELMVNRDSPSAQADFEAYLPQAMWLTSERLHNKTDLIKAHMGQGKQAPWKLEGEGAIPTSDEFNMIGKATKGK